MKPVAMMLLAVVVGGIIGTVIGRAIVLVVRWSFGV